MSHDNTETGTLLSIQSLSKSFGQIKVLENINFNVQAGEVICLLGHSGSGKTTLLRCVNGLTPFNKGRIDFSGKIKKSVFGNQDPLYRSASETEFCKYRVHIGMVFQRFNLFHHLTALENIAVGPRKVLGVTTENAAAKALELLNLVGLAAKADLYPKQLSGGQQQRIAIARALAMEPEIILFDEPTSALDPELVGEVLGTMQKLAMSGVTMLVATHEMTFAREVGTRILFLQSGIIIEDEKPDEFFERPKNEQTQRFLARTQKAW